MAYSVTFTLSAQYTGTTEADNFTIVGKHSNGSPADTTIATGVSKANLIQGVTYQVADTITGGTVTSTGTCTNSVNWTGQSGGGNNPGGGGEGKVFTVERCVDNATYYLSDSLICLGSETAIPADSDVYQVGEYVQFYASTNCNGEAGSTYCGVITDTDVANEATAMLSMDGILNQAKGCTNTECTQ